MLTPLCLQSCPRPALRRGPGFLYVRPHSLLRPYLSHYTLTFPHKSAMSDGYTILPSASSTLVFTAGPGGIAGGLRGTNTQAGVVGGYANQFSMLLLIEFHPAGLHALLRLPQNQLADRSFLFDAIDPALEGRIAEAMEEHTTAAGLLDALDTLFLPLAGSAAGSPGVAGALRHILHSGGRAQSHAVAREVFYSEKQLGRLFMQEVGMSPKTFGRIVRANRALRLLRRRGATLAATAHAAGFYDEAHLIRDFKAFFGTTPQGYRQNEEDYYNETFKL